MSTEDLIYRVKAATKQALGGNNKLVTFSRELSVNNGFSATIRVNQVQLERFMLIRGQYVDNLKITEQIRKPML